MADNLEIIVSTADEITRLFAFLGASLGLAPVRVDDCDTSDFVRHCDRGKI